MANIMSMADIKNRPSRNGFDLSRRTSFTAKVGQILPVWYKEILPGDKFSIDASSFTRTRPVNTAAQARVREYYDYYFVPFSVLWNKFNTVVTQMNSNSQHATSPILSENTALSGKFPYISSEQIASYLESLGTTDKDSFGFSRAMNTAKLLEYLRYGNFYSYADGTKTWSSDPLAYNNEMNIFPLLAYQKIYSDYFRYTQWESSAPPTFNVDYIKGTDDLNLDLSNDEFPQSVNFFDMRYCNYQKDLFHGVLPVAQYGEAAVIPLGGITNVIGNNFTPITVNNTGKSNYSSSEHPDVTLDYNSFNTGGYGTAFNPIVPSKVLPGTFEYLAFSKTNQGLEVSSSGFYVPILALRQAEFLQKWKEVALSGEEDYKSQIQKHWGVSVSEYLSDQSRYVGGFASSLDINEVVNNNITGDAVADIAGKGYINNNGRIEFNSNGEHGILMCVYHSLPLLDYAGTGVDPFVLKTQATDIAIPEMDQVGMQSVRVVNLLNPLSSLKTGAFNSDYLGYAPRYIDYKTDVDICMGDFTQTLKDWLLTFDDEAILEALNSSSDLPINPNVENGLSMDFFKVNPHIVDNIFDVDADDNNSTDCLWCFFFQTIHPVRNLDVNGLPY